MLTLILLACAPAPTTDDSTEPVDTEAHVVWVTVDYDCGDGTSFVWPDAPPIQLQQFVRGSLDGETTSSWTQINIQWEPGKTWSIDTDTSTDCESAYVSGGRIVYAYEE